MKYKHKIKTFVELAPILNRKIRDRKRTLAIVFELFSYYTNGRYLVRKREIIKSIKESQRCWEYEEIISNIFETLPEDIYIYFS
jgi:hypothetical protein